MITIMEDEQQGIKFKNWEEAEVAYYESHQCDSDDVDVEEGRIMRWLDENGHTVDE